MVRKRKPAAFDRLTGADPPGRSVTMTIKKKARGPHHRPIPAKCGKFTAHGMPLSASGPNRRRARATATRPSRSANRRSTLAGGGRPTATSLSRSAYHAVPFASGRRPERFGLRHQRLTPPRTNRADSGSCAFSGLSGLPIRCPRPSGTWGCRKRRTRESSRASSGRPS